MAVTSNVKKITAADEQDSIKKRRVAEVPYEYLTRDQYEPAANDSSYGATNDSSYRPTVSYGAAKSTSGRPTVSDDFKQDAYRDKLLQAQGIGSVKKTTKGEAANDASAVAKSAPTVTYRRPTRRKIKRSMGAHIVKSNLMVARAKAARVNVLLIASSWGLYLAVQLIFALILLVTIGLVGAVDALMPVGTGFFASTAKGITGAVTTVLGWIGIDLVAIATALMGISYAIVIGFGIISLFLTAIVYQTNGIEAFYGRQGAGLKVGAFLISFIGYCVPGLNLFPFILVWMAAVQIYPR
jgi:hypothetical protein